MHKKLLVILIFLIPFKLFAQKENDTVLIKQCIYTFFQGLEKGDTTKLIESIYSELRLQTIVETKNKHEKIITENRASIIKMVGAKRKAVWREKLLSMTVHIDGRFANVWTPYEFYLNNQPSHKGANSFHLIKTAEGWKIFSITDTRHN